MIRFTKKWASRIAPLAIALSTMAPLIARAQSFPDRNIRVVVPAAAGGALDLISRILSQKASEILKQQVYVDNKPGANWIIGMDTVARAAPDGYTLLFIASSGLTINPYVFANMPLEPMRDLRPVIAVTNTPYVLLANSKLPVRSVKDFITYVQENSGKLNHASNSSSTMLVSELFKSQAKLEYTDINYKGASQAMNDTMAGATQFCFVDLGSGSSAIQGGMLKALGLTSSKGYPLAPDIPPIAESGLPGFSVESRTLVFAPAKTSDAIVDRLNVAFQAALDSPEVRDRLRSMGQVTLSEAPRATLANLEAEAAQWKQLISDRNIHFEQ